MDAFPAFIPLAGRTVVVAGEGEAAEAKARLFDGSPARLLRVRGEEALTAEAYRGAALVFVAGNEPFCRAAAAAARAAGALVNAVDRPELCDFNTPGIVDRGAVVGAVGSVGAAPVLVVRLRQEIEVRWPAGLGGLARMMGVLRGDIRAKTDDWPERRRLLAALMRGPWAEAAFGGDLEGAVASARRALADGRLVGAASRLTLIATPEQADLLTLRAARRLGEADRLVLVGDVPTELLALARRDAPQTPWRGEAVVFEDETVAVLGDVDRVVQRLETAGIAFERL